MIDRLNDGYIALFLVVALFLGLQIWWISMTIRNGSNKSILKKQDQIEDIKKRLEKIFIK